MMTSRRANRFVAVVGALVIGLLSGCSGSSGGLVTPAGTSATLAKSAPSISITSSGPTPGTTSALPIVKSASAHAQGKLAGVPTKCPSADDITLALHVSIPKVYPQTINGALNCTYYVDGSKTSPGVNITFGAPNGLTVASWTAQAKAFPSAVLVPGVGDGAVYYLANGGYTAFNFISNGVTCNIYTGNFKADQAHMVTLAESILEG
jgi:hypothetical protein